MSSQSPLAEDGPPESPSTAAGEPILRAADDAFGGGARARNERHEASGPPIAPATTVGVLDVPSLLVDVGRDDRPEAVSGPAVPEAPAEAPPRATVRPPAEDPLLHPDPARRVEALATTEASPSMVRRGVLDPDDGVRAAAVDVALRLGRPAVRDVLTLVGARRWPRAQAAALRALPALVAGDPKDLPLDDELVDEALWVVGTMEPPPDGAERAALAATARAIGPDRLAARLTGRDRLRLGAVRLLNAAGATDWLRSLAAEEDDPDPEVRAAARSAETPTPRHPLPSPGWDEVGDEAILSALARGLSDPDELVRVRAGAALAELAPSMVATWASDRLVGDSAAEADLAAAAVGHLGLRSSAEAVFDRACSVEPEARGPSLRALAALRLSPAELAAIARGRGPDARPDAVRIAWRLAGRSILPDLRSMLGDSSGAVRVAVLEALAEAGDPDAVDAAARALSEDSSVAVRATAVRILSAGGPEERLAALRAAMDDPDPDVRASAVESLAPATAEGAQVLLRALAERDPRVWRAAARQVVALSDRDPALAWSALRREGGDQRVELLRLLERTAPERLTLLAHAHVRDADAQDRTLAIEVAARAGDRRSVASVVDSLQDPDPVVRRAAAAALCTLRSPAAIPALARALLDPATDVRVEAVRALGLIDDDAVPPLLLPALTDPESRVAELAGEALVRSGSAAVARLLTGSLAAPDLRRPARRLLERMGNRATPYLIEAIVEGDADTRTEAGELLSALRRPVDLAPDLGALDPDERLRAVEVLGAMGGPDAAQTLLPALVDPDHRVRVRAIILLGESGDERVAEDLRRTLRADPSHEAAAAAAQALRRLGALPALEDLPDEDPPGP